MEFDNKNIKNSTTVVSMPFCSLLSIAFIVLKLCNVINWSWWWVLSPLWIPIAAFFVLALILFVSLVIVAGIKR